MLTAYRWLIRIVVEVLEMFPPKRIEREEVELRKGLYAPADLPRHSTVWVHGASLGDIITLRPFLEVLAKRIGRERILASAMTMDGYRQLRHDALVGHSTLLPIELPEIIEPFLDRMKPALVLISETEIWPSFMANLADRGIPYGIINARINEKTVRFMKILWPLFSKAISNLSFVYCQDRSYARRFRFLGVPPERLWTSGGFKFDLIPTKNPPEIHREDYGIPPGRQVFCFGSTHHGEEAQLLDALEPLWKQMHATVILAPRHLDRISEVETLLRERHLDFSRLTQRRNPAGHVLLVDTLGELRNLYEVSDLVFVGGSLVPKGGHNLMEPAVFGKPILTGPHTGNFPAETRYLRQAGAFFRVSDASGIQQQLAAFLRDPRPFQEAGLRARNVLAKMAGASQRTLDRLETLGFLPDGD